MLGFLRKLRSKTVWRKISSNEVESVRIYRNGMEELIRTYARRGTYWYTYPEGRECDIGLDLNLSEFIREQRANIEFSKREKQREQEIFQKYGLTDEQLLKD